MTFCNLLVPEQIICILQYDGLNGSTCEGKEEGNQYNTILHFSVSTDTLVQSFSWPASIPVKNCKKITFSLATAAAWTEPWSAFIEEGFKQKPRQRSSRLFGGQILFNSLPR